MRFPATVLCLLSLTAGVARAQLQPPALWAGLVPGPHGAGFATALEHDRARPLDGQPRPIQVTCWFPATGTAGSPLTFRDYFLLSAAERGPAAAGAKQAAIAGEKTFFASVGVDGSLVDRWFDAPVYARAGAAEARGIFPLVLVAQGNGQSAHYQAILSEWLASHGFIGSHGSKTSLTTDCTDHTDLEPY